VADPRITLSAVDKTGAAFESVKRNLLGLNAGARGASAAVERISRSFSNIGRALGVVSTGVALKSVVDQADAYTRLNARLLLVTASSGEFARAQEALFSISQNTRTGLEDTTSLFASLALPKVLASRKVKSSASPIRSARQFRSPGQARLRRLRL
jgi:hypothetical protein